MKTILFLLIPFFAVSQNCEYSDPLSVIGGGHQYQGATSPGQIDVIDTGNYQILKLTNHRVILPALRTRTGHWIYFWRISNDKNSYQIWGGKSTCDDTLVLSPGLPYGHYVSCQAIWIDETARFKAYSYEIPVYQIGTQQMSVKASKEQLQSDYIIKGN